MVEKVLWLFHIYLCTLCGVWLLCGELRGMAVLFRPSYRRYLQMFIYPSLCVCVCVWLCVCIAFDSRFWFASRVATFLLCLELSLSLAERSMLIECEDRPGTNGMPVLRTYECCFLAGQNSYGFEFCFLSVISVCFWWVSGDNDDETTWTNKKYCGWHTDLQCRQTAFDQLCVCVMVMVATWPLHAVYYIAY